jgi:hypothetical protein
MLEKCSLESYPHLGTGLFCLSASAVAMPKCDAVKLSAALQRFYVLTVEPILTFGELLTEVFAPARRQRRQFRGYR